MAGLEGVHFVLLLPHGYGAEAVATLVDQPLLHGRAGLDGPLMGSMGYPWAYGPPMGSAVIWPINRVYGLNHVNRWQP